MKVLEAVLLVFIGWIIAHFITSLWEQKLSRREVVIEYPLNIYKITFTVLLLIVGKTLLFAQSDDKTNFERIFIRELKEGGNQPLIKEQFSMGVSELPNWFWNIPKSTDSVCYAIGISDPEMKDSLKAGKQALLRALMQFSLMSGAKVSGVSDLYNQDLQNKYEEYYKLTGTKVVPGQYFVVDSYTTRYREKILFVKLDRTSHGKFRLNTGIEVYKSNTRIEIGWCSSATVNYFAVADSNKMSCEYVQDEDHHQMLSIYNRDTISIPAYRYEYRFLSPDMSVNESDSIVKLHQKGLWIGYFQAFLDGLQTVIANNRSKMKAMDELLGNTSGNYNINTINRNIINNKVSFGIRKIENQYNQLNISFYLFK